MNNEKIKKMIEDLESISRIDLKQERKIKWSNLVEQIKNLENIEQKENVKSQLNEIKNKALDLINEIINLNISGNKNE